VLLSEAAEPLFGCMVRLLPSFVGELRGAKESQDNSKEDAMLAALHRRSEEWSSERLHAVVRGTRTDQRHPLHSAASGCLDLLQEWLYDSGVSHSDIQDAVAEEASLALRQALRTQLQPAALECLPALADMLSRASHHSRSERMTAAAEEMLAVWATCSAGPRAGLDMPAPFLQPVEVPRDVSADVEALMFASSDSYLEQRVSEAVELIARHDVQWHSSEDVTRMSRVLSPFAQVCPLRPRRLSHLYLLGAEGKCETVDMRDGKKGEDSCAWKETWPCVCTGARSLSPCVCRARD